jgi:hypothetical protein
MATAPFGVPFACGAILGGVIGYGVLLLPEAALRAGTTPAPASGPALDVRRDGAWAAIPTAAAPARGSAAEEQRTAAAGALAEGGPTGRSAELPLLAATAPVLQAGKAREAASGTRATIQEGAEPRHYRERRTATTRREAAGRSAHAAAAAAPNPAGKEAPAAQHGDEAGRGPRPEGLLGLGGPLVAAGADPEPRRLWWRLPTP